MHHLKPQINNHLKEHTSLRMNDQHKNAIQMERGYATRGMMSLLQQDQTDCFLGKHSDNESNNLSSHAIAKVTLLLPLTIKTPLSQPTGEGPFLSRTTGSTNYSSTNVQIIH
jgi:hypothetical protein